MADLELAPIRVEEKPAVSENVFVRQFDLLTSGIKSGATERVTNAINEPLVPALEIAGSFGAGYALSALSRAPGRLGTVGKCATGVLAFGLAFDVGRRGAGTVSAMIDNAYHPENFEYNKEQVGSLLGAGIVDYGVMGLSGFAGAKLHGKMFAPTELNLTLTRHGESIANLAKVPGDSPVLVSNYARALETARLMGVNRPGFTVSEPTPTFAPMAKPGTPVATGEATPLSTEAGRGQPLAHILDVITRPGYKPAVKEMPVRTAKEPNTFSSIHELISRPGYDPAVKPLPIRGSAGSKPALGDTLIGEAVPAELPKLDLTGAGTNLGPIDLAAAKASGLPKFDMPQLTINPPKDLSQFLRITYSTPTPSRWMIFGGVPGTITSAEDVAKHLPPRLAAWGRQADN